MGEAWSDYYAMDYLVAQRPEPDSTASRRGARRQVPAGQASSRSAPWRSTARSASTARTARSDHRRLGGYTYGDVPTVIGDAPRSTPVRRGLGADALGPAQEARPQGGGHADHSRHGAVRRRPEHPRHAQRDRPGRHGRLRQRAPQRDLEGLRQPRHGLVRRRLRRRRRHSRSRTSTVPPAPNAAVSARSSARSRTPRPAIRSKAHVSPSSGTTRATPATNGGPTNGRLHDRLREARHLPAWSPRARVRGDRQEDPVTTRPAAHEADFAPRRDWASFRAVATITDFNGPDFTAFGCGPARGDRPRASARSGAAPLATTTARRPT